MNFLIIFDPISGNSTIKEYADDAIAKAMRDRLSAELLAFQQGKRCEIVILNAKNVDDLRETHARYFGDAVLKAEVTRLLPDPPAA